MSALGVSEAQESPPACVESAEAADCDPKHDAAERPTQLASPQPSSSSLPRQSSCGPLHCGFQGSCDESPLDSFIGSLWDINLSLPGQQRAEDWFPPAADAALDHELDGDRHSALHTSENASGMGRPSAAGLNSAGLETCSEAGDGKQVSRMPDLHPDFVALSTLHILELASGITTFQGRKNTLSHLKTQSFAERLYYV